MVNVMKVILFFVVMCVHFLTNTKINSQGLMKPKECSTIIRPDPYHFLTNILEFAGNSKGCIEMGWI